MRLLAEPGCPPDDRESETAPTSAGSVHGDTTGSSRPSRRAASWRFGTGPRGTVSPVPRAQQLYSGSDRVEIPRSLRHARRVMHLSGLAYDLLRLTPSVHAIRCHVRSGRSGPRTGAAYFTGLAVWIQTHDRVRRPHPRGAGRSRIRGPHRRERLSHSDTELNHHRPWPKYTSKRVASAPARTETARSEGLLRISRLDLRQRGSGLFLSSRSRASMRPFRVRSVSFEPPSQQTVSSRLGRAGYG